jgi:membrane associated rhomboid family serine protease
VGGTVNTPTPGLFRRSLLAVFGAAAVSVAAFLFLKSPGAAALAVLPPALTADTGAGLAALLAGFGTGAILAALLLSDSDRRRLRECPLQRRRDTQ